MFIFKGCLTDKELQIVRKDINSYEKHLKNAGLYSYKDGDRYNAKTRSGKTFFLRSQNPDHFKVITVMFSYVLENYKSTWFDPTLSLSNPEVQYTVYKETNHFSWHRDNLGIENERILTMSVNISDESDYEGGLLEVKENDQILQLDKKPGSFIIFPSFLKHQAYPVTAGVRRCYVVWTHVPNYVFKNFQETYQTLSGYKI